MPDPAIRRNFIRMPMFELTDSSDYDFNRQMQLIADRYAAEERLLSAIAAGDEDGTIAAYMAYGELMRDPQQENAHTSSDPLRDFKNSVLITNTLFRKAIEGNYVHPIYIHESSSFFGTAIEQAKTINELYVLIEDMVHVYCQLVKQCSLAAYTPVVRKALLYIDMNLASPISTKEIAQDQFLSPNYLSTRFKQEVGISISDYLLERRVKLACQLLSTTSFTIQEVAAKTGMGDASYFSKQFKRVMGLSPLRYKKDSRPEKDRKK